jgi:hypothetical protein
MQKATKKTPFVFYAAMVLLCLVLFSAHLTSGLYARYTSTSSAGDNARVAKFDVSSAKNTEKVDFKIDLDFFDPQKQSDYIEFDVFSSSEVAVRYDVVLVLPEGMVELIEDGILVISLDENVPPTTVDGTNRTVIFDAGTFNAAEEQNRTHKLTFSFEEGSVISDTIEIKENATLRVLAEQVD